MDKSQRSVLSTIIIMMVFYMAALESREVPLIISSALALLILSLAFAIARDKQGTQLVKDPEKSEMQSKYLVGRSFRHLRTGRIVSQVYPNSLYYGIKGEHHTHHTVHADFIIGSGDWEEVKDGQ